MTRVKLGLGAQQGVNIMLLLLLLLLLLPHDFPVMTSDYSLEPPAGRCLPLNVKSFWLFEIIVKSIYVLVCLTYSDILYELCMCAHNI